MIKVTAINVRKIDEAAELHNQRIVGQDIHAINVARMSDLSR
jgi:hypothetical protein